MCPPRGRGVVLVLVVGLCLGVATALAIKWRAHRRTGPTKFKGYVHTHSEDPSYRGHPHGTGTLSRAQIASILRDYDKKIVDEPGNGALISEKIHFAIDHAPAVAARVCGELLAYNSDSEFLMSHLVIAHLRCREPAKALHWARKCVDKRKSVDNLLLLGQVYYETRTLARAEEVYRQVLDIQPDNEQALAGIRYIDELRTRR